MPRTCDNDRRVVIVGGESGCGKSRLVREFAAEQAQRGALVLYGASDAVVNAPYAPFRQALDHLARVIGPVELRAGLDGAGSELRRLLPGLPPEVAGPPTTTSADPDTERHRLHTAVTSLLSHVAGRRSVVLILEDVQWADTSTLLLLRHLVRAATGPLLLLATLRDAELELPELLAQTLADLRRFEDVVRLGLTGLTSKEVAEFVELAARGAIGDSETQLASSINALTNGNAFLMCELWRALLETETIQETDGVMRLARPVASLVTPASVREVVGDRLSRLSPPTGAVLDLAATVGREFELDVVRRASGLAGRELLAAVDESVRTGIIEELPGRRLVYRFTHELVRRAAYDRLSSTTRAELHLRVGESLEAGAGAGASQSDLAHHFIAAAPLVDAERAIGYAVGAARAAVDALAFGEAAELFGAALELGVAEPARRAELLIELGGAWQRAGREFDALTSLRAAASLSRSLRSPELLARAAIGYEMACWAPMIVDQGAAELLEEAVIALGPAPTRLRIGLLSGLARARGLRGETRLAAKAREEAVTLARELDDRPALATVLTRSYWSRGTSPAAIAEMLAEARALAEELGDMEILVEATAWRVPTFVAAGDLASARGELGELREMAEATRQPLFMHVAEQFGCALATADGDLRAAETMARRSYDAGELLTGRDSSGTYGIQMFTLRREQGRLAELAPLMRTLMADRRLGGPWRPGLALLLAELGMTTEAGEALGQVVRDGLSGLRESLWVASLIYIAETSSILGDRAAASLVYPELVELSGSTVMIGQLVACHGSADRYLGMLAATLEEPELAQRHFARAIEDDRRMGMATWLAHSQFEYARFLMEDGDQAPAVERLIADAAGIARERGLGSLTRRIDMLQPGLAPVKAPSGLSGREAQILGLVARGLTNREIGRSLFISEHTAAKHISNILAKTGCANRTEAATYAHRHGLAAHADQG